MKKYSVYILLSAIMFLQVGANGVFRPIMSMYLTSYLGFSGSQASVIISMTVITGIISPLAASFIADRLIKARHLLSIINLIAALFAVILAFQTSFQLVLITYLLYMLSIGPAMGLVNAVTFKNLQGTREHFGAIRVFGTLGWVAAGLIFGQVYVEYFSGPLAHAFILSAVMSLIITLLSLFLPDIALPVYQHKSIKDIIPLDAFKTIIRPEFLSLIIVFFLSSTMDRFYFFGTGPYLESLGYSSGDNQAMQTLGQVFELLSIPVLGFILGGFLLKKRYRSISFKGIGFKYSFIIGLSFQVLRYTLFMISGKPTSIVVALLCNGFIYTFFYATATIYVDRLCTDSNRAGVHQIINMIFFGFSGIFGTLLAGFLKDNYSNGQTMDYSAFWLIPTIISIVTLTLTIIFIKNIPVKEQKIVPHVNEDDTAIGPHEIT